MQKCVRNCVYIPSFRFAYHHWWLGSPTGDHFFGGGEGNICVSLSLSLPLAGGLFLHHQTFGRRFFGDERDRDERLIGRIIGVVADLIDGHPKGGKSGVREFSCDTPFPVFWWNNNNFFFLLAFLLLRICEIAVPKIIFFLSFFPASRSWKEWR